MTMRREPAAPITGDNSHWANVFRDVVSEYWRNRMKAAPPCQFVTELADDILQLSKHQGGLTMEALGGQWTSEMEVPGSPWNDPVRILRSPQEIVYQMVANRFHDLGPFQVRSFNGGEAYVVLDFLGYVPSVTPDEFESLCMNNPGYGSAKADAETFARRMP